MTYNQQPDSESTEGDDVTQQPENPVTTESVKAEPVRHNLPDTTDDDTGAVDPEPADDDRKPSPNDQPLRSDDDDEPGPA